MNPKNSKVKWFLTIFQKDLYLPLITIDTFFFLF